ncbi:MAG: hypothetical protein Q4B35_00415 [Slackia sp.]|nr:hypothetical protein [Slackia sp.]
MKLASKTLAVGMAISLSALVPVTSASARPDNGEDAGVVASSDAMQHENGAGVEQAPGSLTTEEGFARDSAASEAEEEQDGAAASEVNSASSSEEEADYDKADFYNDGGQVYGVAAPEGAAFYAASSFYGLQPMQLSDEMKYFAKYESSCNYDQGFGPGDGYHALGYYQFDHRYGLQEFLRACYQYDPDTYGMFAQFSSMESSSFKAQDAIRKNGRFTDLGNKLNAAWHAAYKANPSEFAALQDSWAYSNYYLPAQNYLASRGIDISNRADCVKGLCWGLSNLFGTTGWHKFVGGVSDGYDWNGVYHYLSENYNWPGCGLNNAMSDRDFVTVLCNYVVDNVAVFYKGQPQYHQGWQNRYRNELKDCLSMLGSWTQVGSEWRYYLGDTYLANTWKHIDGSWYWFDAQGYAVHDGLKRIDGALYCFDGGCRMLAQSWMMVDGVWYWLSASGAAATGWQAIGGAWYYLDPDTAAMQTGWIRPDGATWYYLSGSGAMLTGWQAIDGAWYYLDGSGAMRTGWLFDGGVWYYLHPWGGMHTGWLQLDGVWYYLNGSGAMLTGWQFIGGAWYYLDGSGAMAANRWVDGYYVDASGRWIA